MTGEQTVPVADIIGNQEVRELCGGIERGLLIRWRKLEEFPEPIRTLACGELWNRQDVMAWLQEKRPKLYRAARRRK